MQSSVIQEISNFTDLSVLEQIGQVSVRYVDSVRDLHHPDMIVLPGSKNTMADLKWMRENGLEALIKKKAQDTIVFGICGGYQMLGQTISDPYQVESGGSMKGMGLLPAATELKQEKTRTQVTGTFGEISGALLRTFRKERARIRDPHGQYRIRWKYRRQ